MPQNQPSQKTIAESRTARIMDNQRLHAMRAIVDESFP
jgi:hypothetical protein